MGRPGRPTKLTAEVQAQICEHLKAGAHRRFAAAQVGIDENTFSRWYHRGAAADNPKGQERLYREFFLAVNKAEAQFEEAAREMIRSGSAVNPNLALKWLGRRFPQEYGRRDNVEQVSPEDKAAQAQSLRALLIERLERLASEPEPESPPTEAAEEPAADATSAE